MSTYHTDLDKVEKYLRSFPSIRFPNYIDSLPIDQMTEELLIPRRGMSTALSPQDLNPLAFIFKAACYNQPTCFANGDFKEGARTRRTIKDLFLLLNYYYPDTSLKTFFEYLNDCFKIKIVESIVCPDIHKRVFKRTVHTNYLSDYRANEYNLDLESLLPAAYMPKDGYRDEEYMESVINYETYE